jgi:CDP-glucose 4,6-dehydratase
MYQMVRVGRKMKSVIGDIRNIELLRKSMQEFMPDIVIHMAAQPLVRESYINPVDTYAINVLGTVHVLDCVRSCNSVKAVLNVTTDKVYENNEWVWGYRESDQLGGYDPYSNSKACSELVTAAYTNSFFNSATYHEHGVAIATARAGNVIGGGDWAKERLIPDIIRAIQNSEDIIIRNPNAIRPWQHVLEPLSGYMLLIEALYTKGNEFNGSWNFGPDYRDVTVQQVVNLMLNKYGAGNKVIWKSSEKHETNVLKLDCSKSKQLLRWTPLFDLETALELTVNWYKSNSEGKDNYDFTIAQIRKNAMNKGEIT